MPGPNNIVEMFDRETELERLRRFWEHTKDCYDAVYYDIPYFSSMEQYTKRKLNRCVVGLPVKITNRYLIETRNLKSDIGIIIGVNTENESIVVRTSSRITVIGTIGPIELSVNLTLGLDDFKLLEAGI